MKIFGVVAGMAALLVSCNKQENLPAPEGKTIEMTIIANSDDTKTVLGSDGVVTWSAGEQLQVLETAGSTINSKKSGVGSSSDEGKTMAFPVSFSASAETSFSYNAVYPYSALVDKPSDIAEARIILASTQYPTASSFGPAADILISKPEEGLTVQPTELNLQFARVIAVGKMTIKNLNTTENVQKVTLTATGKTVTGRSYINLTNATAVKYGYSTYGVDNVVLDYSGKEIKADGMTAYFTCWPFSIAGGEAFTVVVETENYTFTKNVPLTVGADPLKFNVGRATAFNVSFSDIEGVEKTPATQLVPDGEYVIAYEKNMMTVGTTSNKYRDVANLPEAANEDGSYSVDANAAWNFVYDSETDTYLINSVEDNSLYIQGSSTAADFKLVAKESATSFKITKDEAAGTYRIANTNRFIGYNYNNGSSRFAMYAETSNLPIDLNLYTAKVAKLAEITVQGTLDLTADLAESSFPVSWKNVDLSYTEVNVYQDEACTIKEEIWIYVEFNEDKSAIKYIVDNNDTESEKKAYIKVEAKSIDGESKVSKVIVVTQAAKGSGTEQTWTWAAASGDLGTKTPYSATLNGKAWNVTRSSAVYTGFTSSCIQLGSKSGAETVTLSSNAFAGTIKSVAVECASYEGNHTVDISVGDVSYVSGVSTSIWTKVETISGSGNSSGEIVIKFNAGSRALYIKSITVTYLGGSSEGGSDPEKLATPKVSCSAQTANSLTFTWDEVANASGYQVSTDGGTNYGATQTETTYTWSGLKANTEYTLYVKAVSDNASYTDSDAAPATSTTTASTGTGGETKVYLSEDFSSLTTWGTNSTTGFDLPSGKWTASGYVYEQNGCIKLGKSSLQTNTITTPALSTISGTADVVLTFKAVSSVSGYTMSVVANNAGTVGDLSPNAITKNGTSINNNGTTSKALAEAFAASTATFTVKITGATSATTLTIKTSTTSKQWYLDDVHVVSAN